MSTVTNAIPPTLNDLLVKLKILSMIERGSKINMGSMSFVDSSSWWGALQRALSGEGRKGLMVHINQIISQGIGAIKEFYDTEFLHLIINALAEAKGGILNLNTTYQDDPNVLAQISVLISNIDLQLEKHRQLLPGRKSETQSKSVSEKNTAKPTTKPT